MDEILGLKASALSRVLTPSRSTLSLDLHLRGALGREGLGRSPQGQPLRSQENPTPVLSIAADFTMGWQSCYAKYCQSSDTPPRHHSEVRRGSKPCGYQGGGPAPPAPLCKHSWLGTWARLGADPVTSLTATPSIGLLLSWGQGPQPPGPADWKGAPLHTNHRKRRFQPSEI